MVPALLKAPQVEDGSLPLACPARPTIRTAMGRGNRLSVRALRDRSLLRGAPGDRRTSSTADEALLYRAGSFESREKDCVEIKKIYISNFIVGLMYCALFFVVCCSARVFLSLYLLRVCAEPFTEEW